MKIKNELPKLSYLSYPALAAASQVMQDGAKKHGERAWLNRNSNTGKEMTVQSLLDAASRHIGKYQWINKVDDESGYSHLAHALCNLMMALHYEIEDASQNTLKITPPPETGLMATRGSCGTSPDSLDFPLQKGDIVELRNGNTTTVVVVDTALGPYSVRCSRGRAYTSLGSYNASGPVHHLDIVKIIRRK